MWRELQFSASLILLLSTRMALAGINWKAVWLEPRTPVVLTVGETKPYTVMGLNGADVKADLTKSQYLKITSSDPDVLFIDQEKGVFVGKQQGHVDIHISFSEASDMVPAFVREPKTDSAAAQANSTNKIDGVWKAVFTGPMGERPKMVSEIVFDVTATGNSLTGIVHAASWPGDAAMSDGRIDGDRVTFTMTGHLPFQANGVTGYPKLCFTGTRQGDEMKIDLRWHEAERSCEGGKLLPMAAKKIPDCATNWHVCLGALVGHDCLDLEFGLTNDGFALWPFHLMNVKNRRSIFSEPYALRNGDLVAFEKVMG
jgi:hypothetical protein